MRVVSPAKINLHLRIGPIGADGFHPLLSWMCTVGLHDVLEMELSAQAGIRLKCDRADVPADGKNLIVRAGEEMRKAAALRCGAAVTLEKKIPIGGGMGGGSSNAAAALMGFNRLWSLNWPMEKLAQAGARLGSDVPFFFHGPSSVCAGRGEKVTPIDRPRPRFVLLIFPRMMMSTPAVYRRFDEMELASVAHIEQPPDWKYWATLEAEDLLPLLVNDLEAPAFSLSQPLAMLRDKIESKLGRIVRMSGSGSTLFTLFDVRADAEEAERQVKELSVDAMASELAPV